MRKSISVVPPGLALSFVLALLFVPSVSAAAEPVLWARLGGIGQGPQGTFKKGIDFGVGLDAAREGASSFGLGLSWVREGDRDGYARYEGTMWSVDAHSRSALLRTQLRPVLELGVSYSQLRLEHQWQGTPLEIHESNGPGGIVGGFLEYPLNRSLRLSAGARYHVIVTDVSAWGSNSEDYFAIGGSVRATLGKH